MFQDTAPLGADAFGAPVTSAVSIEFPPTVGFGEAETEIDGFCFVIVKVRAVLEVVR